MSEEEQKDSIKISVPLYTNQELEEMDRIILDEYETIMDKISKQVYKEKELIVLQKVIEKQQAEINKKDKIIDEMAEMLTKDHEWFYSEFDNYTKEQFIEYFTNKVKGESYGRNKV